MIRCGPLFYADNQCLACGQRWKAITGPTQCPSCGHLYVKWLDFEEKWEQRGVGYMPKPEFHNELLKP